MISLLRDTVVIIVVIIIMAIALHIFVDMFSEDNKNGSYIFLTSPNSTQIIVNTEDISAYSDNYVLIGKNSYQVKETAIEIGKKLNTRRNEMNKVIKWYAPIEGQEDDFLPLDYRLVDNGDELLYFPPLDQVPYKVIAKKFFWDEEQHLLCLEVDGGSRIPFVGRFFKDFWTERKLMDLEDYLTIISNKRNIDYADNQVLVNIETYSDKCYRYSSFLEMKNKLKDNEELYVYDDMDFLHGSFGFIIKDKDTKKVVDSKTLAIS